MIDYRALLLKYIRHVSEEEGTNFIHMCREGEGGFTRGEILELEELAEEARQL